MAACKWDSLELQWGSGKWAHGFPLWVSWDSALDLWTMNDQNLEIVGPWEDNALVMSMSDRYTESWWFPGGWLVPAILSYRKMTVWKGRWDRKGGWKGRCCGEGAWESGQSGTGRIWMCDEETGGQGEGKDIKLFNCSKEELNAMKHQGW